jgi:hypothetical protein
MIPSHELFNGALVSWVHKPRGGYGFTIVIPAKIVKLSLDGSRATIEVEHRSGRKVRRSVMHTSLRWRDSKEKP